MKLTTTVPIEKSRLILRPGDKVTVLGSCFADSMGERLLRAGIDANINPFGTLYNPVSISNAVSRLDSGKAFTADDCIQMGAGAGLICSFEHHTSFARTLAEDFLANANSRLEEASARWKECRTVIVTLGTAQIWKWQDGRTVSNCLKRPGTEFTHEMLSVEEVGRLMGTLIGSHSDKSFILTVSPIRHLGDGAHVNTLSKAVLQLGIKGLANARCEYFPAYEILLDELRDYRFYADDLVHPSHLAEELIWERFLGTYIPVECQADVRRSEKSYRQSLHRSLR